MMRHMASDSRQVREALSSCNLMGDVKQRIVLAMATMYGYGGVEQDLASAFAMFELLSEEDKSGVAHSYLACFFKNGWVVKEDLDKAIALYEEGVALGNAACMASLGLMLHKGDNRHRNLPEAIRLFRAAAALGCPHGANNAAVFILEQTGNYSDSEALAFLRKAADCGEGDACYSFFVVMQHKEPHLAARYLLKARDLIEPGTGLEESVEDKILTLMMENSDALVPYGYWEPIWRLHELVSPVIWREMQLVLMMRKRAECPLYVLPRDVALEVCFWLCTFPRPEDKNEDYAGADETEIAKPGGAE